MQDSLRHRPDVDGRDKPGHDDFIYVKLIMWRRIHALVVKEFLALMKDRKIRLVLIGPPLLQMILFANAATFDVTNVALGIWDEDGSLPAVELIHRFTDSPAFARVATYQRPEEVASAITEQRVAAVLHIGQRFAADLKSRRVPALQLILDARHSNTALIAEGYAQQIVTTYAAELALARGQMPGPEPVERAWFNPNLSSQWFILPALVALLSIVLTLMTTALSVARERELGTFDQLLVTPLLPIEIVIGKTAPSFAIGLAEAALLVLVAIFFYRVPFVGDPLILAAGLVTFLLSGVGIGLAISSVAKTQQQAILGVFLFLAPAIILSGFGTPIENMPGWCQDLTLIDPIRYMLVLVRGVFLQDMPWSIALGQLWPMAVIGLATFGCATWLFGRRLG